MSKRNRDQERAHASSAVARMTTPHLSELSIAAGYVLVGNSGGRGEAMAISGDIAISSSGVVSLASGAVDIAMLAAATNQQCVQYFLPAALNNFPAPGGVNSLDNDNLMGFTCPVDVTIDSVVLKLDTAIAAGDAADHLEFNLSDGTNELISANVDVVAGIAQYAAITLVADQNNDLAAGDVLYIRLDLFDDGADADPPTDMSGFNGYVTVNYSLR